MAKARLFVGIPENLCPVRDEAVFQLRGDLFAVWCPAGEKWQWAIDPWGLEGLPGARAINVQHGIDLATEFGLPIQKRGKVRASKTQKKPKPAVTRQPKLLEGEEGIGDGGFKVVRVGDATMLVVAGKVQMKTRSSGLYYQVLDQVRVMLQNPK